jgi:hypothetical protein
MVMSRARILGVFGLLAMTGFLQAQEPAEEPDPRLGGEMGRLRYRIARGPAEEIEAPDVLTLRDGRRIEAHFLNVYGDRLVFYVKQEERTWLREELYRSEVASVAFDQYLPEDPLLPRSIEPAEKQPAPKDDFLAGVFEAAKGRSARFKLTFTSEIDKLFTYTEDATDYGTVEVETRSSSGTGDHARSHEVSGWGRYYLYAPGSINNEEWVLLLSEVVVREVDRGFDTVLFTNIVPDEAFILRLSPEKDSFKLEWSNLGSWHWSSLTNATFRRAVRDGRAPRSDEPVRLRPRPGDPRGPTLELEPTLVLASSATGSRPAATPAAPGARRWRTDGWKPPPRRWR